MTHSVMLTNRTLGYSKTLVNVDIIQDFYMLYCSMSTQIMSIHVITRNLLVSLPSNTCNGKVLLCTRCKRAKCSGNSSQTDRLSVTCYGHSGFLLKLCSSSTQSSCFLTEKIGALRQSSVISHPRQNRWDCLSVAQERQSGALKKEERHKN